MKVCMINVGRNINNVFYCLLHKHMPNLNSKSFNFQTAAAAAAAASISLPEICRNTYFTVVVLVQLICTAMCLEFVVPFVAPGASPERKVMNDDVSCDVSGS